MLMSKLVKKGDKFLVGENIKTTGISHWFKPYTGDFPCVIPMGTILIADDNQLEGAKGFYLIPEDYKGMEEKLVPKEIRSQEKYSNYSFVFMNTDIGKILKPI
jgi:hypothetical protein